MAVELVARVVPGGLMAVNAPEASKLDNLKGREVQVKISIPRNLAFHRRFFALLSVARDLADTEFNAEQFRAVCITGAGYCDFIEHDGKMVAIPRSISFASMDDTEFENLYSDVLDFICSNWVIDYNQIDQILSFL